jgi:hypothetical protein
VTDLTNAEEGTLVEGIVLVGIVVDGVPEMNRKNPVVAEYDVPGHVTPKK